MNLLKIRNEIYYYKAGHITKRQRLFFLLCFSIFITWIYSFCLLVVYASAVSNSEYIATEYGIATDVALFKELFRILPVGSETRKMSVRISGAPAKALTGRLPNEN
jgi:hypothetical protein